MLRFAYAVLMIITLSGCIGSGQNFTVQFSPDQTNQFPILEGTNLHGKTYIFPEDFGNQLTVAVLAFERHHQKDVDRWLSSLEILIGYYPKLRIFEIPMLNHQSALRRFWINNRMRQAIGNYIARERTVTVYTNRQLIIDQLDIDAQKVNLFVVNHEGVIVWHTDELPTSDLIADLRRILSVQMTQL